MPEQEIVSRVLGSCPDPIADAAKWEVRYHRLREMVECLEGSGMLDKNLIAQHLGKTTELKNGAKLRISTSFLMAVNEAEAIVFQERDHPGAIQIVGRMWAVRDTAALAQLDEEVAADG